MEKVILCLALIYYPSVVKAEEYRFEKNVEEIGYKEVNDAWLESENHFKHRIALPTKLPPIPFTHHFGRLTNDIGKLNDHFEVIYLHEDYGDHHFFIRIVPIENGLPLRPEHKEEEFILKGGQTAIYSTTIAQGFNCLLFEKAGWQYLLAIDKRVSNKVPAEGLVEIANSIK